jgi:hypothetical protein
MMSTDQDSSEPKVDAAFRNGTVTTVGIVLGFSLNFLTRWAANPVPWQKWDIVPVVPIFLGLAFQLKALADLLSTNSLRLKIYKNASRLFVSGLIITLIGVGIAITLDVLSVAPPATLRQ